MIIKDVRFSFKGSESDNESVLLPIAKTINVQSMQRTGTEANRTRIQPSKPKREITNITNSQNTKRTHGQPSEQLFSKSWPHSNSNLTKNNMNTHKVKRHRNFTPKTDNREPQQNHRLGTVSNELLVGA